MRPHYLPGIIPNVLQKRPFCIYQIDKLLKAQHIGFGQKVKHWKLAGTAGKSIMTLQGHLTIWSKVEDENIISRWTPRETCMVAKNVHNSPIVIVKKNGNKCSPLEWISKHTHSGIFYKENE